MPANSETIDQIYWTALQLTTSSERRRYLDQACGCDEQLRVLVESLLKIQPRVGHFLEQPYGLDASSSVQLAAGSPGTQIGSYRLVEKIGEGGMGLVYLAEQLSPVRRLVALKIIRPGMDSRDVLARFDAERQTLALMDHPNIARILDAGSISSEPLGKYADPLKSDHTSLPSEDARVDGFLEETTDAVPTTDGAWWSATSSAGRPYFVMELVRGLPITEFCDQERMDLRARLKLFLPVCDAIQHAHRKDVIHRDLKPTNVLVTKQDGHAVPKIIDFGVAKAVGPERTLHTGLEQLVGTPLYMSPEQAELDDNGLDARSDIYSLGVILYELVTGTTPFNREDLQGGGLAGLRRILREVDPPLPSQRIRASLVDTTVTGCDGRGLDPRRAIQQLRGELDWIVMKSLEKDCSRRYQSVSELALDIQRFLDHKPITARPASAAYRIQKWVRRHQLASAIGVICFLSMSAMSLGAWYYHRRLSSTVGTLQQFQIESHDRGDRLRLQLYAADMRAAWQAWESGNQDEVQERLSLYRPQPGKLDPRGFEWYLLNASTSPRVRSLLGHTSPILTVDVSLDDRFIASADSRGVVKIWDLATASPLRSLSHGEQEVTCARFAPDGQSLATCGMDKTIRLWRVSDWSEMARLEGHDGTICSLAWSPDSKRIVSGGRDRKIKIWDVTTHSEFRNLPEQSDAVRCVAWSPNGESIAAAVRDDGLHIWNTKSWKLSKSLRGPGRGGILALAFMSDSKRLASGGYTGLSPVLINDITQQQPLAEYDEPHHYWSLRFTPDNACLFASRGDGDLQVWEARTSETPLRNVRTTRVAQPDDDVKAIAFAHQGQTILSSNPRDHSIEIRKTASVAGCGTYRFAPACADIDIASNRAILRDPNGKCRLKSIAPPMNYGSLSTTSPISEAVFFPQGDFIATVGSESEVRVFDARSRELRHVLKGAREPIRALAISPDGRLVTGSGESGTVWLWDVEVQSMKFRLLGHQKATVRSAFSPNGKLLATGSSNERHILLWSVATGKQVARLPVPQDVMGLAFSPDSEMLAVAGYERSIFLWNVTTRGRVVALRGHTDVVRAVAFAPDGRTLASVSDDGTARLWNLASQQEVAVLCRRRLPLAYVRFLSPQQLAVATQPYHPGPSGANDVLIFDVENAPLSSNDSNTSPTDNRL